MRTSRRVTGLLLEVVTELSLALTLTTLATSAAATFRVPPRVVEVLAMLRLAMSIIRMSHIGESNEGQGAVTTTFLHYQLDSLGNLEDFFKNKHKRHSYDSTECV